MLREVRIKKPKEEPRSNAVIIEVTMQAGLMKRVFQHMNV